MRGARLTAARRSLAAPFTPVVCAFIPFAVALNLLIGTVVQVIKLPVFLDSIGTVLVAGLAGPLPAIVTALLTVVVAGVTVNPMLPWFAGTAITIGWFSGVCANRGAFRRAWTAGACGVAQGIIAAVCSAPVIVLLFGGITQSGSSLLVAFLVATGETVLNSVLLAGFACDPADKLLTFLIAHAILRGMPRGVLRHFPRALFNPGVA